MYEVVVIGAGPGGICSAIKLRTTGIEDFLILEKEISHYSLNP